MSAEKFDNQIILANAAELGTAIVRGALGNAASDTICGTELTNQTIASMIQSRLQYKITNAMGAK